MEYWKLDANLLFKELKNTGRNRASDATAIDSKNSGSSLGRLQVKFCPLIGAQDIAPTEDAFTMLISAPLQSWLAENFDTGGTYGMSISAGRFEIGMSTKAKETGIV